MKLYREVKASERSMKDCTSCKYFESWYDAHGGEDELEPSEYGRCDFDEENDNHDVTIGEGYCCDKHKRKNSSHTF